MFENDKDELKPISIIITTLAAHAYTGERDLISAIRKILTDMHLGIQQQFGKYIIPNPTDVLENFADKWEDHPERATAFFQWLEKAREDFLKIAPGQDLVRLNEHISKGVGRDLGGRALAKSAQLAGVGLLAPVSAAAAAPPPLSFSNQRRDPEGPQDFG